MKQHVEHLRRVFEILRRERFYVKLSKSEFALEKVQFLGHMVSAQGVHVDPKKIEAVRTWKTPENVKELQQFLGFANYYNRFVPQYAKLAAPLTNLLKKNTPYKWEMKHQEAVEQLKQALTSAPVLILPDPERDYVIEADASDQAVGAVLMQDQGNGLQPIAYLSKKLHGAELNYPIHDKEALAIIIAFKAWRCYLEGRRTTVYTDHCSLKYLKTQPNLSRRQVRWIDFLETHFHYDIVYKPGHKNKADALSRPAHVAAIQKMSRKFVTSYDTCQRMKSSKQKKAGLLQPLPVPEQPWQVVSLDFITGLPPTSSGHDAILVVIDKFSKMGHFIPTHTTARTEETAQLFVRYIISQHGIPTTLISDRDPKFTSKFWKELMSLLGTKLAMSSAYHPQTDGQTERLNQIVEQLLRAACKDDISKWDLHLPVLEFAYNNATHAATGQTPFFLCYGRHPLTPQKPTTPAKVQPAHDFITTMHQLWDRTHKRLLDIQQQQKRQADRHRNDHTISVGDQVLLDTRNLDISHLPSKLRPRFCGPFLVEAQLLLEEYHNVLYAGHFGSNKTLTGIAKHYYWPHLAEAAQKFVTSCDTCQRMKSSKQKKAGLLQPLLVPEQPWQVVSLEFITGLPPTTSDHDAILVVIDKFSKSEHFIPTHTTARTEETAQLFVRYIISQHGIPTTLISDHDSKFTSKFWKELLSLLGTKLAMSSAYHPQIDGQTKRLNQIVEKLLRAACKDEISKWDLHLPVLEFAYNNATHAATGQMPFFLCYGGHPLTPQNRQHQLQPREDPLFGI
ncbi:hypothetical protein CLOP_g10543 [Closterium sp. NIES-67]|nr:hypothetical protein CLOP_g10543 [Closterium sp. NIES-67]